MAKGNIKAKLIDEKGITINGYAVIISSTGTWKKKTAGGTFKFKNLVTGPYRIVAYSANKAAVSAVKNITVKKNRTITVTLVLKKTGGTPDIGCYTLNAAGKPKKRIAGMFDNDDEPWVEVTESVAQKLVEKHGGEQGDNLTMVEAAESDLPLPYVELAASAQIFQAPDGFKIFLVTDDAHMEYFFVHRGTEHVGLRLWQYGVIGVAGAGAGVLLLRKRIGTAPAVVGGALITTIGAAIGSAVLRKRA